MSEVAVPHGASDTAGQAPLPAAKLTAPPPRRTLVSRPRLLALLDEGVSGALTLLAAPAGFGKTTLVGEWVRRRPWTVAWVSLDAADNDPARFWSAVVRALAAVHPRVGDAVAGLLQAPRPPPAEGFLAALLDALAGGADDTVLVLDDYHAIESRAIHDGLARLVEHLPPHIHFVIAGRADPPLPLARLRARGTLAEVRAADLRFTPAEAAAFLHGAMGLDLPPDAAAALAARVEGWIAGLQLAALAMRGRRDTAAFIAAFAGSHRYIVDYLTEEVLGQQPEGVQAFLLRTAILDRLTGDLCDAVTGARGGGEMLERLERANLFLVPLDDERRWYRYHGLFAEVLRARAR